MLFGLARVTDAQDKKGDDADKKREDVFGKPFAERVEEAITAGCEWLKKQQGIEKGEDQAIFGIFPKDARTYDETGEAARKRFGRTAFPIQALCKSGVFHDEPEIQKAMAWLRKNYTDTGAVEMRQGSEGSSTYEDATVLNAIEAYYISAWETKARGLSSPGSRFQKDKDGKRVPIKRWGTEEKGASKKKKKDRDFKLESKDRKLCEIAVKALQMRFRSGVYTGGGWRYHRKGAGENDPEIDVSATQYAILGLKCATRLGIRYDKTILIESFRFLRAQQDKDGPEVKARWKSNDEGESDEPKDKKAGKGAPRGKDSPADEQPATYRARGWGYARQSKHQAQDVQTYGGMTAAGVNALIVIRDEMVEDPGHKATWVNLEKDCNQMIGDGLAWLIKHWTMTSNPMAMVEMYRFYYYLYSIERLAMMGGIDEIGGHDWYREGADTLLKQQKEDGKWDIGHDANPTDIWNTCYALLFLKRATEGVDKPAPVFTGGDYE
jgi:hypothetical protein